MFKNYSWQWVCRLVSLAFFSLHMCNAPFYGSDGAASASASAAAASGAGGDESAHVLSASTEGAAVASSGYSPATTDVADIGLLERLSRYLDSGGFAEANASGVEDESAESAGAAMAASSGYSPAASSTGVGLHSRHSRVSRHMGSAAAAARAAGVVDESAASAGAAMVASSSFSGGVPSASSLPKVFVSHAWGCDYHREGRRTVATERVFSDDSAALSAEELRAITNLRRLLGGDSPEHRIDGHELDRRRHVMVEYLEVKHASNEITLYVDRNSKGETQTGIARPGESFSEASKRLIDSADVVLVFCHPYYLYKVEQASYESGVRAEYNLIQDRLSRGERGWLYPLVICGDTDTSVPNSWLTLPIQAPPIEEPHWDGPWRYSKVHNLIDQAVGGGRAGRTTLAPALSRQGSVSLKGAGFSWGDPICEKAHVIHLPDLKVNFFHAHADDTEGTYLHRVHDALFPRATVASTGAATRTAVITGMGGIGKTQLALAYAQAASLAKQYDFIFWFNSEDERTLAQSYEKLMEEIFDPLSDNPLNLNEKVKKPEGMEAQQEFIKRLLPRSKTINRWLLVYDNVPDASFLDNIPPTTGGHVLVTTRDKDCWDRETLLPLSVWDDAQSATYLCRELGVPTEPESEGEEIAATHTIAGLLKGLPLALNHTVSYIREEVKTPRISHHEALEKYITVFEKKHALVLAHHPRGDKTYPYEVATTWNITQEKLSVTAKDLLHVFSYMDPEQIPVDTFVGFAGSDFALDASLMELERYGLLNTTPGDYGRGRIGLGRMHRLVQLVERYEQENEVAGADGASGAAAAATLVDESTLKEQNSSRMLRLVRSWALFCKGVNDKLDTGGLLVDEHVKADHAQVCLIQAQGDYTNKTVPKDILVMVGSQVDEMLARGEAPELSSFSVLELKEKILRRIVVAKSDLAIKNKFLELYLGADAPKLSPLSKESQEEILRNQYSISEEDYKMIRQDFSEHYPTVTEFDAFAQLLGGVYDDSLMRIPLTERLLCLSQVNPFITDAMKKNEIAYMVKSIHKIPAAEREGVVSRALPLAKSLNGAAVACMLPRVRAIPEDTWREAIASSMPLLSHTMKPEGVLKVLETLVKIPRTMWEYVVTHGAPLVRDGMTGDEVTDILEVVPSIPKDDWDGVVARAKPLFTKAIDGSGMAWVLSGARDAPPAKWKTMLERTVPLINDTMTVGEMERISAAVSSVPEDEWEGVLARARALGIESMDSLSVTKILMRVSKTPEDVLEELMTRARPLLKDHMSGNGVNAILDAVGSIPTSEWDSVYAHASPLLRDHMSGDKVAAVLKVIMEIPTDEREGVILRSAPLLRNITDGHNVACVLKGVHEFPSSKWNALITRAEPLINHRRNYDEVSMIINIVGSISEDEWEAVYTRVRPFILSEMTAEEVVKILEDEYSRYLSEAVAMGATPAAAAASSAGAAAASSASGAGDTASFAAADRSVE